MADAKDPKDVPFGSGLLEKAKQAFLNRDARLKAAEEEANRGAKQAEKDARKAPYVP
jgi:hypothetical protein